jgi:hypothetical protein
MKHISLKGFSEDTRRLLIEAEKAGGLVLEDESGQTRSRVYAYPEASEAQRDEAWGRIRKFQQEVQQSFDEQGIGEDDLDQLLQEDS